MSLEFEASIRPRGGFEYQAAFTAESETLVLFGHSGAGKSLTLQAIAGLARPAAGRIVIEGTTVFDSARGINLRPEWRRIGYVVQDLALFPNMTVAQNIAFGMDRREGPRRERVAKLVALLQLQGLEERRPRTLSGGQQQRVALARALGRGARVLLLDEPFSALDEALRATLRHELLRLRADLGLATIFVTHDLREAHLLADRLAVFDNGRILQCDRRETVFRTPLSRRVAELTGVANIFEGRVLAVENGHPVVEVGGVPLVCARAAGFQAGQHADVCIRAERVILHRGEPRSGATENLFEAVITAEFGYGATHTLRLAPLGAGPALEAELAARPYEVMGVAARREWTVELPRADLHAMQPAP